MIKELSEKIDMMSVKEQWQALKHLESWQRNKARYKTNRFFERNVIGLEKKCQNCGTTSDIEFHHQNYSKYNEINILCKKCHLKIHNGSLEKPIVIDLFKFSKNGIPKKDRQKVVYKKQWVKDLWLANGYSSPYDLGNECGVSGAYIEEIARSGLIPSEKTAKLLAEKLKIDYQEFLKPDSQSIIIGNQIRNLRTSLGETQEEFARKIGVKSKTNIANYESGRNAPSDEIKMTICKIYGCTLDYLFGNHQQVHK